MDGKENSPQFGKTPLMWPKKNKKGGGKKSPGKRNIKSVSPSFGIPLKSKRYFRKELRGIMIWKSLRIVYVRLLTHKFDPNNILLL